MLTFTLQSGFEGVSRAGFWHSPGSARLGNRLRLLTRILDKSGPQGLQAHSEVVNEEIVTSVLEPPDADQERDRAIVGARKAAVPNRTMEILNDPQRLPITDIANRWGSWHMRQFTKHHRTLFGMPPSQRRVLRNR